MAAIETSLANAFETQLTANVTDSDLTFPVGTVGSLTSPTYLVIDPDNPTKREYIFFDGTFTTSDLVTTSLGNRGLAGSASGAQGHTKGAKVRAVPMQQHFEDLHDRMDTAYTVGGVDVAVTDGGTGASSAPVARTNLGAAADAEVVHLAGAETISGAKTFSVDPTLADGSSALSLTEGNAAYLDRDGGFIVDLTSPTYGVLGDGSDESAKVQAAIDAWSALTAAGTRGATLIAPPGFKIFLGAQVVIKDRVVVKSVGRGAAVFQALPTFPINTPLFRIGAAGAGAFGARLEDCGVNCADIAGVTGVYSDSAQELSGVRRVSISGYRGYGVNFEQGGFGSQNYVLEDIEVEPSTSADSLGGVRCAGAIGSKNVVQGVTHNSSAVIAAQPAAVIIDGSHVAVRDIHGEDCTNVVLFTGTSRGSADNISGAASVTTCVRIETSSSVRVGVVNKGGATNAIIDSTRNRTITDSNVSSYDTHRAGRGVTRLHLTANKSVADGYLMSDISWGAATFDPESNWNGTTGYVCDNVGYYRVMGQVQWAAQAGTGQKVGIDVRIGGTEKAYLEEQSNAGQVHTMQFNDILFASAAGQAIVIQVAQDSDSGMARDVISGAARTFLTVEYIGV